MKSISVRLLGEPLVKFNGEKVYFPYKKSEGLFYYVCINKQISREDAINIFWADNDEKSARKNLRDAIYKIKKTLCNDIFISASKTIIELNNEIDITIDTDNISPENILLLYNNHFLHNFLVKNCYDYEAWITEKRIEYKNIYIKAVIKKVNELANVKDFNSIQKYSSILIENDPYNEKTYRYLMKIYALSGEYNKAVKIYYDLTEILKKDLDISPEINTKKMFRDILKLKDTSATNPDNDYFYGRYDELYSINKILNEFSTSSGTSILIIGEAGIGKTALINKIVLSLDITKNIILKSVCYNAEEEFFLKPWHNIFALLGEHVKKERIHLSPMEEQIIRCVFPSFNKDAALSKYDNIESLDSTRFELAIEAILQLLSKLSEKKNIIIIIDDMQWMDKMSKLLLSNIITHFKNKKIIIIGAYRDDYENKLSSFTVPLIKGDYIIKIKLHRFSLEETKIIANKFLIGVVTNDHMIADIYNDTEGNALFLVELLKVIQEKGYTHELSSKAANIIKSRIMDLTKNEMLLLNYISLFFDKVSIDCLKFLMGWDELLIFDIIESLQEKKLIQELITDKDIFYTFTHQKIREYIYNNQALGKKNILHEKIGLYFEDRFKASGNKHLYTNLIYHFGKCGNIYKSLKFKIENLTDYYTIYHETYPVFSDMQTYLYSESDTSFNVEEKLLEITKELNTLNDSDTDYLKLKMEIAYLSGRYYISVGEYGNGLENIDKSMRMAEILDNTNYLLNNYKQMIFYSIQVNDIPVMYKYINKSFKLLERYDNIEERGTILRLKGLYYIKTKKYENAIELLNESINIFSNLNRINNKYKLSISACYNYLGQSNKDLEKYQTAYEYFKKSIDFCSDNSIEKGLETFYSNIGQVLYEMGSYDEAEHYINKSIQLFERYKTIWGRDIAECYASLININNNNLSTAKAHYEIAYTLAKRLNNPKSLKLTEDIKKQLNYS